MQCSLRLHKRFTTPYIASVPVVCVGNITMGGAGKTPVAIALAEYFTARGYAVHFLSRGYGRQTKGMLRVDNRYHHATDVGDEPLLLSQYAPVWVCTDRVMAAKAAIADGATLLLMDDGLQNFSLHKDLSFLVIDGHYGLGNQCLFPAGPLREPLPKAAKRVNAAILINEDHTHITSLLTPYLSVLRCAIVQNISKPLYDKKLVAFAGIGYPDKFFTMLTSAGLNLIETVAFPDHYPYTTEDINTLFAKASANNALLVTTEKDAMRFPAAFLPQLHVITITIKWDDTSRLDACINAALPG